MEENTKQQDTICSDKMDTDTKERVNILELTGKCNGKNTKSQTHIISEIFNNNIDKKISKRELEREFTLKSSLKPNITNEIVKNMSFSSIDDITDVFGLIPGDVQRQVRSHYDKFKKYGLTRYEEGSQIYYMWSPILKSELDIVVHPVARNIFSQDKIKKLSLKVNKVNVKYVLQIHDWQ